MAETAGLKDGIYIVKNGELKQIEHPKHGEVVVKFVKGEAQKYDKRESTML